MNGYVYIIERQDKYVKIGRSAQPKTRIRNLQTQGGLDLANSFTSEECSNYKEIEREMHKTLRKHRTIGEWFDIDFNKAVAILKNQHFKKPLTEKELRKSTEKAARFFSEVLSTNSARKLMCDIQGSSSEREYHCDLCMCPIEIWNPLGTYDSDRSCEILSDFHDVIWDLEEKTSYNFDDIIKKCTHFEGCYLDIEDFPVTIKELIHIGIDTGIITDKYAR